MDMIIKSRVTGQWALAVFENFSTDHNLPKHCRPPSDNEGTPDKMGWGSARAFITSGSDSKDGSSSWWRRLLRRMAYPESKPIQPPHGKMSAVELFALLKKSPQTLTAYLNRMGKVESAIDLAKKTGQTARLEHLNKAKEVAHFESLLISGKFTRFIDEASLIEFAGKCEKGLNLTWIANYTGEVPAEVVHRKTEADAIKVFDNYVVLHYDPQGQNFSLTLRQIEAKKDPILFGVIAGVRKLYFVGDWKNATDDLTMEEVARVLGRTAGEIYDDPTQER